MPDLARWSNPESYFPSWSGRSAIVGSFLSDCRTVVDLGAGNQVLRQHISAKYYPVDCVALGPDTILIDFDGEWSIDQIPDCEGVAIAGLLEHIADPLGLIAKIAPIGQVWAVSYMDRDRQIDKSLLPLNKIEKAFQSAGFRIDDKAEWKRQRVYRLVRE